MNQSKSQSASKSLLLSSDLSRELYARVKDLPIVDYHSHLTAEILDSNRSFQNLTEVWISGDHYKWRAMRLNGEPEQYCSGQAGDEEKFAAWARTLPLALRNPIFNWSAMELQQYFGITRQLTPQSAREIWEEANAKLATDLFRPLELLKSMKVEILCTTEDPADDLRHHHALRQRPALETRIYPTFRPDAALHLQDGAAFRNWVERLSAAANIEITGLADLLDALKIRHDAFHAAGCRVSDHGLDHAYPDGCGTAEAEEIFARLLAGKPASVVELERWRGFLMRLFAEWNHQRGWVMTLHLGALRNNNTRIFRAVGADTGCDSIGDFSHGRRLNRYLDSLDLAGTLPKTIIFNSNPADNLLFATIAGNYFEEGIAGKVQYGPAWWFLDTCHGIREQFNALSLVGLAQHFVGMVTDSRSFLSFTRHDYFRRVVCDLYASDALTGLIPTDSDCLAAALEKICYRNAATYFNWDTTC